MIIIHVARDVMNTISVLEMFCLQVFFKYSKKILIRRCEFMFCERVRVYLTQHEDIQHVNKNYSVQT